MLVASWGDRAHLLGSGGTRTCKRCNNTNEHALIDVRTNIKLMFIPVGSLKKGKNVVCPVCTEMTPVGDSEAARLVRESMQRELRG